MKILVSGGAGFIASHVADAFINQGHNVTIIDNLVTGFRENVNPSAKFIYMSICDPRVADIGSFDVVCHHAAQMDVRKSVADPMFDATINILGSLNLLMNVKGVKKFIHISSGGAAYGEPDYNPVDENHPIDPLCPYGITKHTFEHYLYTWKKLYNLDYVVLRYPNVYGPRQNPHGEAGVTAIFAKQMLDCKEVVINGDGEQKRDYVYVSDIANANLLALEDEMQGIYNVGSCEGLSVNDIFYLLKMITGYTQTPVYGPAKLGETRYIWLDNLKISGLGWKPLVGIEEGLTAVVNSLKGK